MNNLYTFDIDSAADLTRELAGRLRKRRLERGLSREALSLMSGVPVPTIAKFERQALLSLPSFVALAKALGYASEIRTLLTEPIFHTMEEMETIKRNKNRKRGRNEMLG